MAGVTDKLRAAQAIRNENPGEPLTVDQRSRMMDVWATHPGTKTLHRKGGVVGHANKSFKRYKKGGIV